MYNSFGAPESHLRQQLDRFSRSCKPHDSDRQTDKQTDHATRSVAIGRSTAMRRKNWLREQTSLDTNLYVNVVDWCNVVLR